MKSGVRVMSEQSGIKRGLILEFGYEGGECEMLLNAMF